MRLLVVLCLLLISSKPLNAAYIAYCPCMGRFGNQADHFLGSLGFAKGINRTLILPPWVEYRPGEMRSVQVPFDTYFDVSKLEEFHDVITMEEFMAKLAPTIWPPERRISFCYTDRGNSVGCSAKDGNPFGPFWDTFQVDFVGSEKYGPLGFDVYRGDTAKKWQTRYKPDDWPVLAFVGAPASFPVQIENRELHKYLKWSDKIDKAANEFIKNKIPKGGFIGIHLRNGVDWVRACEHVPQSPNLFAAPQCLGYRNEHGPATQEMCYPTTSIIVRQLKRLLRQMKDVKSIFVASDSNHMIKELRDALKGFQMEVLRMEPADPHVELAVLGRAHHFVGNCISSFSAFVKRERDVRGFKTTFWGFPTEKKKPVKINDEL